jgi:hypothetical protein
MRAKDPWKEGKSVFGEKNMGDGSRECGLLSRRL